MNLIGIEPDELRIGAPLAWDVYNQQGQLLLCKDFTLDTAMLQMLSQRGMYRLPTLADGSEQDAEPVHPLFAEMCKRGLELERMLKQTDADGHFPDKILNLVEAIRASCNENPDGVLASILLNDGAIPYSIKHAIDTAAVCEIVGNHQNMPLERRTALLAAAITMDIALLEVVEDVPEDGRLPEIHAEVERHHPQLSVEILRKMGVTDPRWLTAVLHHHERVDGTGYPNQLSGQEVSLEAQLLHLADIYTSRIAPKDGHRDCAVNQPLRDIFMERGKLTIDAFATAMIKALGVFPPGCLVRLVSGETAIVVKRGESANTPFVRSLLWPRGAPMDPPKVRDTNTNTHAVHSVLREPPFPGMNLQREILWNPQKLAEEARQVLAA